eukprot:m.496663 g.496663  ORF g.496663 m.496663 type:complete len:216 (-) comp21809_c0_seq38:691-1338(-)
MAHNVRGRCRWHTNETVSTGCGYYAHHLSLSPYTIATATTGAAFFSEYTAGVVSGEPDVCGGSINWILNTINRSTGVIPYILDNTSSTAQWPWDTASYVTEGLVAAVVRNCSVAQHERWRMSMLPVLRRALAEQVRDNARFRTDFSTSTRCARSVHCVVLCLMLLGCVRSRHTALHLPLHARQCSTVTTDHSHTNTAHTNAGVFPLCLLCLWMWA